ncbi:MAG: ATP-dependent helicase [Puniceicoccales bacterium]|jgi:DNA helicase-2/ATP-dependent DNA helicase PcrA|nr:ATP-dependent helicase [Puniceicoccales bacterium]
MPFHSAFPVIDFRAALNDDQYRAVTAGDGPALVLAGAGSGKTRTLTYRVAWLLARGVRPWEILLLTFTNKAAKEMLYRVEDLTGVPRGEFWGGTFHSIGQRILRGNAVAAGVNPAFNIMDADEADSLFAQIARAEDSELFKVARGRKKPGGDDARGLSPKVVLDAFSYARNTCRPPEEVFCERFSWAEKAAKTVLPAVAAAYQKAKHEQSLCDYDDLLELWLRLLRDNPDVRRRYQQRFRHILVDEFQDTNKLQGEIVDALAGEHQIMAVGDDAQCIYTWRGAEFANVADFSKRHPNAAIHKIEVNYRSSPEILNLANGILAAHITDASLSKTLRASRPPSGKKPVYVPLLDASEQALYVCRAIKNMHYEGRSLADVIVLYRAHYQSLDLQMELTRQGIPFTITSGVRFFEQAHIRDLIAHLRFVNNPEDSVAFNRLAALLPRVGPKTAQRILEKSRAAASSNGISLVSAFTLDTVLEKVPAESRDSFRDLALTLQNMEEALHGSSEAALKTRGHAGTPPTSAAVPVASSDLADNALSEESDLFGDSVDPYPPPPPPAPPERGGAPSALPRAGGPALPAKGGSLPGTREIPAAPTTNAAPAELVRIALEGWYGDYLRNIYTDWKERKDDLEALVGFAEKHTDLSELLSQVVLLSSETSDKEAELSSDNLRLTTIHQAKGLEFPVVFLIGCAQGQIPSKRAIEAGDISEERRLFYVACTRAKDELHLVAPRLGHSYGGEISVLERSEFIDDLPMDAYQTLNVPRLRPS